MRGRIVKRKNLEALRVADLMKVARSKGLTGFSKLRKSELIELLLAAPDSRPGSGPPGRAPGATVRGHKRKPRDGAPAVVGAADAKRLLSPTTLRTFARYRLRAEQRVKMSKYYLGVREEPKPAALIPPEAYGESTTTLMVRDPYWLFTYWEFPPGVEDELSARMGEEAFLGGRWILRVYDVTGTDAGNPVDYHDIAVAPQAQNWYINVVRTQRDYCVDIGILLPDGSFVTIARSNVVSLPPPGASSWIEDEWESFPALGELIGPSVGGTSSASGGLGKGRREE